MNMEIQLRNEGFVNRVEADLNADWNSRIETTEDRSWRKMKRKRDDVGDGLRWLHFPLFDVWMGWRNLSQRKTNLPNLMLHLWKKPSSISLSCYFFRSFLHLTKVSCQDARFDLFTFHSPFLLETDRLHNKTTPLGKKFTEKEKLTIYKRPNWRHRKARTIRIERGKGGRWKTWTLRECERKRSVLMRFGGESLKRWKGNDESWSGISKLIMKVESWSSFSWGIELL